MEMTDKDKSPEGQEKAFAENWYEFLNILEHHPCIPQTFTISHVEQALCWADRWKMYVACILDQPTINAVVACERFERITEHVINQKLINEKWAKDNPEIWQWYLQLISLLGKSL